MEVQAQYPSSAVALFTPTYPPRKAPRLAAAAAHFFQTNGTVTQLSSFPAPFLPPQQQTFIKGTTMFSGEPESELTCTVSGSRKRALLVDGNVAHDQQRTWLPHDPRDVAPVKAAAAAAGFVRDPSSLQATCDAIRLDNTATASTSGRPPAEVLVPPVTDPAISPMVEELLSEVYQQSLEVDAFIRLQYERIRSGLEAARKRHHRALLSAIEQGLLRRLREKDAELEIATRRNLELEEKIRQLTAENQMWFDVARNNDAIVASLRATLDQVLLQNAATGLGGADAGAEIPQDREEGYGESDCAAPVFPADDAQSWCYQGARSAAAEAVHATAAAREEGMGEVRRRGECKACLKRDVSVLLLPCRHLCLCEQCDPGVDACPVCNAVKDASVQVFMC